MAAFLAYHSCKIKHFCHVRRNQLLSSPLLWKIKFSLMFKHSRILAPILLISLLGLSACAYRPTIQQGNILSETDLHAVHRGMDLHGVVKNLGNPVLSNIYPDGRLVYIYTLQPNHKQMKKRQLIVTFRSGRVVGTSIQPSPNMPS